MFCRKCGAQIEDGLRFCTECGEAVEETISNPVNMQPAGAQNQSNGLNDFVNKVGKKNLGIIGGAIVAVIVLFFVFNAIFGKRSPEDVVDKYIDAMEDLNPVALLDLVHDELLEAMAEEEGTTVEALRERLKEIADRYKDNEDIRFEVVNYSIVNKEECSAEEIAEYNEELAVDLKTDIQIEEMYNMRVVITVERQGEKDTEKENITVVKINGNWYLDIEEID